MTSEERTATDNETDQVQLWLLTIMSNWWKKWRIYYFVWDIICIDGNFPKDTIFLGDTIVRQNIVRYKSIIV